MKHWDPTDSLSAPASEGDWPRLVTPRRARRRRSELGSRVGLAIAIAFVVGLAWAVAPTSPVAKELRR